MKPSVILTVTSLLSIVLLSLHISEDIVLGFAGGGLTNLAGMAVLVVFLCGALLLSDRRSGLVIVLIGSILAAAMPVLHMTGAGVGVKRSAGAFFFIWTLYALGVTGTFGVILAVRALRTARTKPAAQELAPWPSAS
jgi:hypothetical protein